jgi:hypothetical protein
MVTRGYQDMERPRAATGDADRGLVPPAPNSTGYKGGRKSGVRLPPEQVAGAPAPTLEQQAAAVRQRDALGLAARVVQVAVPGLPANLAFGGQFRLGVRAHSGRSASGTRP